MQASSRSSKASLITKSMRRVWTLSYQAGNQYCIVEWTRAKVATTNDISSALQPKPASCLFKSVTRDVSFLRSDSRCRGYVSNLFNVTARYLGSEQKDRVSLLKLTFSSRLASSLLRWKTVDTIFAVLSFSFQVWRYLPRVAISLLSIPSTVCQPPCMIARSSVYAYFLERVIGKSEVYMWKRRGAKTDSFGKLFLRCRNLLHLLLLVIRVRLRLPTISMIMRTMCLSGRNRSNLQVRPRCHTVS